MHKIEIRVGHTRFYEPTVDMRCFVSSPAFQAPIALGITE